MSALLTLVQGSDEWHAHRLRHRNASEAAAVMSVSPWTSPYQLWESKTGRRVPESNWAMQRGTELEPAARAAYEAAVGNVMEPVVMIDGEYSASLDGISLQGDLILEVKCPVKGRDSDTWKEASAGRVQPHYYWQVQQQLMVSGASKAHFFVFDGTTGISVDVLPNPEEMERLRVAWDDFMVFVGTDSPPPLTVIDTLIRNDPDWQVAADQYIARKENAEAAIKAADDAKAALVALAQHSSERGFGVSVCRYWKSRKQEVRVTLLKQEPMPC